MAKNRVKYSAPNRRENHGENGWTYDSRMHKHLKKMEKCAQEFKEYEINPKEEEVEQYE